jgi:Flp pilus assembly protein TadG
MHSLSGILHNTLQAFRSAQAGNVAITFAISFIPVVLGVGAAIDYSRANSGNAKLREAADSAALSAARGIYTSNSERVDAGIQTFNGVYQTRFGAASVAVKVADNTVTVTATNNVATTILSAVGIDTIKTSATAVARIGGSPSACILALQPSDDAVFVHGAARLMADCGLYSNSKSNNGIDFDGDSATTASSICVAGHYVKDSSAKINPAPTVSCPVKADPLANLPVPSNAASSCTYKNYKLEGKETLNPGVYCGGLEIASKGKATFNPGIYIIRDGQFKIGSSAHVSGEGVFFYLTGSDAFLNQGSNSDMTFTAPKTGTYKGIVLFQSRTANTPANKFGGSSNDNIEGAVYFPNGTAEIACNGGVKSDYSIWIVKRLQIDSNATFHVKSGYAGSSTPLADGLAAMVYGTGGASLIK